MNVLNVGCLFICQRMTGRVNTITARTAENTWKMAQRKDSDDMEIVLGVIIFIVMVIVHHIAYYDGKKDGIKAGTDSCAATCVEIVANVCCPECKEEFVKAVNRYKEKLDISIP